MVSRSAINTSFIFRYDSHGNAWAKKPTQPTTKKWISHWIKWGFLWVQISSQIPSDRKGKCALSGWFICNSTCADIPPQRKPVHWVGALIPGCLHFQSVTGFPQGGGCMSSALQRCWPNALCLIVEIRVSLYYTLFRWPKQYWRKKKKHFVNIICKSLKPVTCTSSCCTLRAFISMWQCLLLLWDEIHNLRIYFKFCFEPYTVYSNILLNLGVHVLSRGVWLTQWIGLLYF